MDVITRLTNFFNLTKIFAITVPGMIGAAAIALIFWPPTAPDVIMVLRGKPPTARDSLRQCQFQDTTLAYDTQLDMDSLRALAKRHQMILDKARDDLNTCIAVETSVLAHWDNAIKDVEYAIKFAEITRDSLQRQYIGYVRSGSPLQGEYGSRFRTVQAQIAADRNRVVALHDTAKQRLLNVDLEKQYLDVVNDRLKDPGRLRPKQKFDEVWEALTNHIIAFLVFSIAVGAALDPIAKAMSGYVFDSWVGRVWGSLRSKRYPVGRIRA